MLGQDDMHEASDLGRCATSRVKAVCAFCCTARGCEAVSLRTATHGPLCCRRQGLAHVGLSAAEHEVTDGVRSVKGALDARTVWLRWHWLAATVAWDDIPTARMDLILPAVGCRRSKCLCSPPAAAPSLAAAHTEKVTGRLPSAGQFWDWLASRTTRETLKRLPVRCVL
jgi:hypothetical protein